MSRLERGIVYYLEWLFKEFVDVLNAKPVMTQLAEHRIETGTAKPINQTPYYLYREKI